MAKSDVPVTEAWGSNVGREVIRYSKRFNGLVIYFLESSVRFIRFLN